MTANEQKTATIYRFPIERRLATGRQRESRNFPRPEVSNECATVAAATSWYHAEAIEAERNLPFGAPH